MPDDPDQLAIPDGLCHLCEALFSDHSWFEEAVCERSHTSWRKHYDVKNLERSASTGCHLCSLMIHELYCNTYTPPVAADKLNPGPNVSVCLDFTGFDPHEDSDGYWMDCVDLHMKLHETEHPDDLLFTGTLQLVSKKPEPLVMYKKTLAMESYSQSTLQEICNWIARCTGSHSLCTSRHLEGDQSPAFLPSRLLRIDEAPPSIRVVDRAELPPRTVYTTLSYRWPDVPALTLTESTENKLRQGIAIGDLSRVMQDATWLTGILGCQYIWVDAFCIKQDSDSDWLLESAAMCDVYAQSFVNISASMADPQQGLFKRRNPLRVIPCEIRPKCPFLPEAFLAETSDTRDASVLQQFPLYRRGWVFQERFLAPRVLHFTEVEIIWECASYIGSEVYPHGRPVMMMLGCRPFLFGSGQRVNTCHGGLVSSAGVWMSCVEIYSELDLTFESDKLPAIAGFARRVHQASAGKLGKYYAGLFEESFVEQLDWRRNTRGLKYPLSVTGYRAPSWSWASVNGTVRFSRHCPEGESSFVTILEVSLEHIADQYGLIKSGSVRLRALLYGITLSNFLGDAYETCEYFQTSTGIELSLDDEDACFSHRHEVAAYCIPLAYYVHSYGEVYVQKALHVLLLTPTGKKNGQYRRLGIARIVGDTAINFLKEHAAQEKLDSSLWESCDDSVPSEMKYTIEIV